MEQVFFAECQKRLDVIQTCIDKAVESFTKAQDSLFTRFNTKIKELEKEKRGVVAIQKKIHALDEDEKIDLGQLELVDTFQEIQGFDFESFLSQEFCQKRVKNVPEYIKPNPCFFRSHDLVDVSEATVQAFKLHSFRYLLAVTEKKLLIVDLELPKTEIKEFDLLSKVSLFCVFSDMSKVLTYDNQTLKILQVPKKRHEKLEEELIKANIQIEVIEMTQNNKFAISSCRDQDLKIWDLDSKSLSQTIFIAHQFVPKCLVTSETSEDFYFSSNLNEIFAWNFESLDKKKTFAGHSGRVNHIKLTNNSKMLVSGSKDGFIKIWDINSLRCLTSLNCGEEIFCFAFDVSKFFYLLGLIDRLAVLIDADNERRVERLKNTPDPVVSIEIIQSTKLGIFIADGLRFINFGY